MTLFWNILQSIITILEIRVCVWMMECFARPRYRGIKQKIVVWIVSVGVGGAYALHRWTTSYYSRTVILTILAGLCLASVWMFAYHIKTALFVAANYLLIDGLLDLVVMSISEIIAQEPDMFFYVDYVNDMYRMIVMIVSKIVLLFLCWIVYKRIDKRVVYHLTGNVIKAVCISLCVIEYVSIHALTEILNTETDITSDFLLRSVFFLIVIFLLLIMSGIIILYYDKKNQLQQQTLYLQSLDYENQRMIRLYRERGTLYHDFKNHLFLLDTYVQNGEMDEFREYMDSIKKPFLEKPVAYRTGHNIMDLILNYKISEADSQNISVRCRIRGYMTYQLSMTDEEVCSLLGNLWDNAIEACQKLEEGERWINFEMRITENKFLMEITNPCGKILWDEDGRLQTTKTDKGPHGIGVRTIKDITERHGGYFNYVLEDHAFRVEVMIYNE